MKREDLLNDLLNRTDRVVETVRMYREISHGQLNAKPNAQAWSALECLEHLNLYGDFYLPEMERRILGAYHKASPLYKPGVLGNYFANMMLPKQDGTVKKMKSPKDKNPAKSSLSVTTVDRFLKQQEHLIRLLEMARKVDLTRTKTAISLTQWIRLRLGDTFRFYTYHIERHVAQAERALRITER